MSMSSNPEQKILFQTSNATLHLFTNEQKDIISTSNARISQIENVHGIGLYLSVDSFQWIISNEQPVARLFPQSGNSYITYIFTSPTFNGVYTLTFSITLQAILKLEAILSKSIFILDFPQAMQNQQFSQQVNKHCPYLEHQMFGEPDKCQFGITWTGKAIGSGFKFVGTTIAKGVEIVGTQIHKRVSKSQKRPSFSEETNKRWGKVKEGSSAVKSLVKDMFMNCIGPIAGKGAEVGKKISNKMETSKVSQVRYTRQLVVCTGQAIMNIGKGAVEGVKEVGGQISTQAKKIYNKKYGDEPADTYLQPEELSEGESRYRAYFGQPQIHSKLLVDNINSSTPSEPSETDKH